MKGAASDRRPFFVARRRVGEAGASVHSQRWSMTGLGPGSRKGFPRHSVDNGRRVSALRVESAPPVSPIPQPTRQWHRPRNLLPLRQ